MTHIGDRIPPTTGLHDSLCASRPHTSPSNALSKNHGLDVHQSTAYVCTCSRLLQHEKFGYNGTHTQHTHPYPPPIIHTSVAKKTTALPHAHRHKPATSRFKHKRFPYTVHMSTTPSPHATHASRDHRVSSTPPTAICYPCCIFPAPSQTLTFSREQASIPTRQKLSSKRQCTKYPSLHSPHTPPWLVYTSTVLPSYTSAPSSPSPRTVAARQSTSIFITQGHRWPSESSPAQAHLLGVFHPVPDPSLARSPPRALGKRVYVSPPADVIDSGLCLVGQAIPSPPAPPVLLHYFVPNEPSYVSSYFARPPADCHYPHHRLHHLNRPAHRGRYCRHVRLRCPCWYGREHPHLPRRGCCSFLDPPCDDLGEAWTPRESCTKGATTLMAWAELPAQ